MVATNRTALDSAREGVREFFLLEQTERKVAALTARQRQSIRTYLEAASRRLPVARDLRGPIQAPAALALYRQGGLFLALAYLVARDDSFDPASQSPEDAFRKLDAVLETDGLKPPAEFERVKPMLLSSDPLELDRLTTEEAGARVDDLEVTTRWLSQLFDPRSPRDVKMQRYLRVVVATACAIGLLVYVAVRIFSPKNLALDKPAVASSYMFSTIAAGAVDGSRSGQYGYHSLLEDSPWLSIDLLRTYLITKIKVFGRGDGIHDQSIPLALEVSDDGSAYREIATRNEPFSDFDPWVIKPTPPLVTRFLRLRTMRRSYLVLGEVEVYGNVPKAAAVPAKTQ